MTTEVFISGTSGVLGIETLMHLRERTSLTLMGLSRRAPPIFRPDLPNTQVDSVFDATWMTEADQNATIVHYAGLANPRAQFDSIEDLFKREISPQIHMVERLLDRGWRGHLIYVSSGGAVYGDVDTLPISEDHPPSPKSFYALQKLNVENALQFLANQFKFRLTILRVANPYGSHIPKPGQGVIPILLNAATTGTEFTIIGSGEELRDYVYISDLCRAIETLCLEPLPSDINTINIGSGIGTSLNQLIDIVVSLTGSTLNIRRSCTRFDVKSNVLDVSRAKNLLNWTPRIGIREGVASMVADVAALRSGLNAKDGTFGTP
ncbi:MAG: NAD-dependent epimerase/dehydratase family protein [Rhodobacteraceae bacterium]|nr:NAD-dependent epimerase/dehydratase family protein [Paracoccaceae bacterium]